MIAAIERIRSDFWYNFLKSPITVISALVVTILVTCCLFAEVFATSSFRLTPDNRYEALAEWSLDYGDCLEKAGRPEEAREIWTKAIDLPRDAGNGIWQDTIRDRLTAVS